MLELGLPAEWRTVEVVLAGASLDDLGLCYYEDRHDRQQPPLGWIPLHAAHIDTLEVSETSTKQSQVCYRYSSTNSDCPSRRC